MLSASNRKRSSSTISSLLLVRASDSALNASTAANSVAEAMPMASNTTLFCGWTFEPGRTSNSPRVTSAIVQPSASVTAKPTTRRDADNPASSGTITSQTAANEAMPPVLIDTAITIVASATDDNICALS